MKRILLFVVLFISAYGINAQIRVASNGNVAIGHTSPASKLDFRGPEVWFNRVSSQTWSRVILDWNNQWSAPRLYSSDGSLNIGITGSRVNTVRAYTLNAYDFQNWSDESLKENIRTIEPVMEKILNVQGMQYNLKNIFADSSMVSNTQIRKTTFGFIAQELEKVFPELVNAPDSNDSHYSINYMGMIPIVVEAIKEQQTIIMSQKARLDKLESELEKLKKVTGNSKSTTIASEEKNDEEPFLSNEGSYLLQNTPNPFSENTRITYRLTDGIRNAMICIYDLNGIQLKSIPVYNTGGEGTITLSGGKFRAGMYLYTLIADGRIIDTKRMVLTD